MQGLNVTWNYQKYKGLKRIKWQVLNKNPGLAGRQPWELFG